MTRRLQDDLRENRRRALLWATPLAIVATSVVMLLELRDGEDGLITVARGGVVALFVVSFVVLRARPAAQPIAESATFGAVAALAGVDLVGRVVAAVDAIGTEWVVAWLSYSVLVALAPYVIWSRGTARRVAVAALGSLLLLFAAAATTRSTSAAEMGVVVVPLVVVILAEALAATAVAVARREAKARAEAVAGRVDQLTGLPNRRGVVEPLAGLRPGDALLLGDVDRFKQVNDTHGHEAGDVVLRQVAATLQRVLRDDDVVARWGGEEFLVVAPAAADADVLVDVTTADGPEPATDGLGDVGLLGERLRAAVASASCAPPVTISIGVALMGPGDEDWQDVLRRADACLYQAKRTGRDRVVVEPTGGAVTRDPSQG